MEWDYGDYDGRRTADIEGERPGWRLFTDGSPGGESLDDVGARADRVIARLRAQEGNVLHLLIARFCGFLPCAGSGLRRSKDAVCCLRPRR